MSDLDESGDLGAGIEAGETAQQIAPSSPGIAYVLARLYLKAGREADAAPLLRLAIHLSEDADMVKDARERLDVIAKLELPPGGVQGLAPGCAACGILP